MTCFQQPTLISFKNKNHIVNSPVPIRHLRVLDNACILFLNYSFRLQITICSLASYTSSRNFSDYQQDVLRNYKCKGTFKYYVKSVSR